MGFEWEDVSGVLDKIVEEVEEFRQAATEAEKVHELGDLFLVMVICAAGWTCRPRMPCARPTAVSAVATGKWRNWPNSGARTSPNCPWTTRKPCGRKPRR